MNRIAEIHAAMRTDSFVPLESRIGAFVGDFLHAHQGKDIIIWGAGVLGRCLIHQLKPFAAPGQNFYFTDSNPEFYAKNIDEYLVLDFHQAMERLRGKSCFMVVAVAGHMKSATSRLAEEGFTQSANFDSYLKISRPEAVIQVSTRRGGIVKNMNLDAYQSILAKLKSDVQDLFHIDLSGWGEPLDNPRLPDIIRYTRQIVHCTVTTSLMTSEKVIENVLRSAPTQFVVTVDGFDGSYRENTPRGNWEIFLDRLRYLSSFQGQLSGKTEIRLKYNIYKNNDRDDFDAMHVLCERLGIKIVKSIGYIGPYDITLALCQSGDIDSGDAKQVQNLAWSMQAALSLAKVDQARPCLCQRIFPVIHTDGSVGICHLYKKPRIHDQYLAIDHEMLLRLRQGAENCRTCQKYALHRLDIDVLESRHATRLMHSSEDTHA